MTPPRILDLFSGIGGFSLGLERAGCRTVAFCEIDPFCRRVLEKHWPGVPIIDDITKANFQPGSADIIVGGFPCQDISRAGKRAGLAGERSGLYRELVRAIRMVRPRHAIVENVAALLGDGMGAVLGDLAESGYDAEWDCVPAESIGAPHERDRVFLVAHATVCGRGEGRQGRPADSFAGVREQARKTAADPYGARLAFGKGVLRDAQQECASSQRGIDGAVEQSIWPDEPALLGMDDGISDRVDRVRALGNSLLPQIPEMIGRAILAADKEMFNG